MFLGEVSQEPRTPFERLAWVGAVARGHLVQLCQVQEQGAGPEAEQLWLKPVLYGMPASQAVPLDSAASFSAHFFPDGWLIPNFRVITDVWKIVFCYYLIFYK